MIGVFDSGIGGLGVLAEIRSVLPVTDLVYVADHAAAPYGTSTLEEVRRRAEEVTRWLIRSGCDVVVIACNTASAAALHELRQTHPNTSFVGMEPAVKPAAAASRRGVIGVVATGATFQGELFSSVVDRFASDVTVHTVACPRWVELVEAGVTSGPIAVEEVRSCLQPLLDANVDTLVLACTHYPALTGVIAQVLGPAVDIIDPAPAVADQTARIARQRSTADGTGSVTLYSTADHGRLSAAATRLGFEEAGVPLRLN